MSRCRLAFSALAILLFVIAFNSTAQAQSLAIYVSAFGSDSNPGTREYPCRTITRALALVPAKGEVVIIDSGDYDAFNVQKAVTIQAVSGAVAVIPASTDYGTIKVYPGSDDMVVIRNLTITRGGQTGIYCTAGHLIVENCVISGFSSYGIYADCKQLMVKDTTVRNCNYGVATVSSWSFYNVTTVDHCRFERNSYGLTSFYNSRIVVRDSIATGNSWYGFQAKSYYGYTCEMNIENCLANYNGSGILVDNTSGGSALIRVSNSVATSNNIGFHCVGSTVIYSRGNNTVRGNTLAEVAGTVTAISGT